MRAKSNPTRGLLNAANEKLNHQTTLLPGPNAPPGQESGRRIGRDHICLTQSTTSCGTRCTMQRPET
nr:MAG TPA: hypothetical protein [Caudoviricetes sp.]